MRSRFGLFISMSTVLGAGSVAAQTTTGPISLTPEQPLPRLSGVRPGSVPRPMPAATQMKGMSDQPAAAPASTKEKRGGKPRNPEKIASQRPEGQKLGASKTVTVGVPHTLTDAMALTYSNQPALQAERAKLRATDENVPAALSGWRPTVQFQATAGYGDGLTRAYSFASNPGRFIKSPTGRMIGTATVQASQTLYNGGKTQATINRAKNQVMGERATLIAQEQTSFTATVNAYVGVIQAQQQLALNQNNEIVLTKQLQATNDRFRVGEITRTDVAQAEAALAGARAQRQTSEGQLETARGVFQQIIGILPPPDLVPPQPLLLPLKSEAEAIAMASVNNPLVIAAQFADAAAKDAVDVAFAQLMPQINLQGQMFQQNNASGWSTVSNGYQVTAVLAVPLYQGGSEYEAVRQARQQQEATKRDLEDKRRTAVQNAVQAWETLTAARAAADSTRAQIRANEIALEGVEREAIVGSRTTLDVLNAQQQLLNSRTSLVQNLAQLVNASYAVASAVGRLTARDMHLNVPLYDETAYYNAVRDRWAGLGNYATNQPGR